MAEEVKTAHQGEVIGLFIEEKIERGMTLAETIAEIRRQGGLVYVPHPFDRMHSVPDYEHLLDVVEDIDILEVFNPRVALDPFNEEAVRFAAQVPDRRRRRARTATSPRGSAASRSGCATSTGPQEFLESMRDADIVRKHKNLVYVQALKFLQTSGGRDGGRRRRSRGARRGAGEQELMHAQGAGRGAEERVRQPCHRPPTTRSARSTWSARSASSTT